MKNKKIQFIIKPEIIKSLFSRLDKERKDRSSFEFKKIPTIFFMDFSPGFKGEEEVHEKEDDFFFVFEGEGILSLNRKKGLKIKKGDFVYIPNKMVHKLSTVKKGIKYIVVKVKDYGN